MMREFPKEFDRLCAIIDAGIRPDCTMTPEAEKAQKELLEYVDKHPEEFIYA